MSPQQWYPVR